MTAHQGPKMSPRIKAQLNQQVKPQVAAEVEKPLSTNEVQETAVSEPIQDVVESSEQAVSGHNLYPEKVQNLDAEEGDRCSREDGFEAVSETISEFLGEDDGLGLIATEKTTPDELAEMLAKSVEPEPETFARAMPFIDFSVVDQAIATAQAGFAIPKDKHEAEMAELELSNLQYAQIERLGPQPDGSFNIVVSIPEEYVAGVMDAAQSAERTPSQWATERYVEWLEAYYTPSQKR